MGPRARRSWEPVVAVLIGVTAVLFADADVSFGDSAELGAAAATLGVAHPSGFALEMCLWNAAGFIPIGPLGFRQNLVTSLGAALALWLLAALVRTRAPDDAPATRPAAGAALAVCGFGAWATFRQAAVATEVYATTTAIVLGAAYVFLTMLGCRRVAVLGCLAGLGAASHVEAGLLTAGLWAVSLASARRRATRLPVAATWVSIALLATLATLVIYLPLASLRNPALDWGDPQTPSALFAHLTGARIRDAYASAMFGTSLSAVRAFGSQLGELAVPIAAALLGLPWLLGRERRAAATLLTLFGLDVAYATLVNPMGIADRQVGFVAGACACAIAGMGFRRMLTSARARLRLRARIVSPAILATALVCIAAEAREPARTDYGAVELFGSSSGLIDAPSRAIVLCRSDDACAGALFAVYAEGVRPDLAVAPAQHLWDATVRRRLGLGSALASTTPLRPRARSDLAERVVQSLRSGAARRPVLGDGSGALHGWQLADANRSFDARIGLDATAQPRRVRVAWARAFDSVASQALGAGDLVDAEAGFERAWTLAPERPVGWTNLGVVLGRLGEVDRAIRMYQRAIELDPTRPTPWANLVALELDRGDLARARHHLEATVRQGLHDPRLDALRRRIREEPPTP